MNYDQGLLNSVALMSFLKKESKARECPRAHGVTSQGWLERDQRNGLGVHDQVRPVHLVGNDLAPFSAKIFLSQKPEPTGLGGVS